MADHESNRDKLIRFYKHYAPDKVETTDLALQAYAGREDQMFKALERKYGPMSAVPNPPGGDFGEAQAEKKQETPVAANPPPSKPVVPQLHFNPYRARLMRFYEQYAPEKIGNVDAALEAYKGKEDAMFRALEKKYGPEPPDPAAAEQPKKQTEASGEAPEKEKSDSKEEGTAQPAPPPLVPETPKEFDYRQGVVSCGVPSAHVEELATIYGPGKEDYALAIVVVLRSLDDEKLFDPTIPTLPFPEKYLKKVEPMDQIAHEHVMMYRSLYVEGWSRHVEMRDQAAVERESLVKAFREEWSQIQYRMLVLREALVLILPIEEESRQILWDEESLRWAGMMQWFRMNRDEVLLNAEEDIEKALELELKWSKFKTTVASVGEQRRERTVHSDMVRSNSLKWNKMAQTAPTQITPNRSIPRRTPIEQAHHTEGWKLHSYHSNSTPSKASSVVDHSQQQSPSICRRVKHSRRGVPSASKPSTAEDLYISHSRSNQLEKEKQLEARSNSRSVSSQSAVTEKLKQRYEALEKNPFACIQAKKVAQKGEFSGLVYHTGEL